MRFETLRAFAAGFSAIVALALSFGYFSVFGPSIVKFEKGTPSEVSYINLTVGFGRIAFHKGHYFLKPHFRDFSGHTYGYNLDCSMRLDAPDFKYSVGEFRAHATLAGYVLSFPIWCVLLPCLIWPIVWMRKRRKLESKGFSVVMNQPQAGV